MNPDMRYRMPVVFGPSSGPRQGPDGERFNYDEAPRLQITTSFLTEAAHLEALLPEGFSLDGEPVVTVEILYLTQIEWLAGRGYNTLGVKFPARFKGRMDEARGPFLSILWENMPEPILTGREELGFAKLYCEIPEPTIVQGVRRHRGVWDGHEFMSMEITDLADAPPPVGAATIDGTLHYRYFPSVGGSGEADCAGAVMTPAAGVALKTDRFQRGEGRVVFHPTTWRQMPTMFQIINVLAALPVMEWRGSTVAWQRGGKDLSDQRPLR